MSQWTDIQSHESARAALHKLVAQWLGFRGSDPPSPILALLFLLSQSSIMLFSIIKFITSKIGRVFSPSTGTPQTLNSVDSSGCCRPISLDMHPHRERGAFVEPQRNQDDEAVSGLEIDHLRPHNKLVEAMREAIRCGPPARYHFCPGSPPLELHRGAVIEDDTDEDEGADDNNATIAFPQVDVDFFDEAKMTFVHSYEDIIRQRVGDDNSVLEVFAGPEVFAEDSGAHDVHPGAATANTVDNCERR